MNKRKLFSNLLVGMLLPCGLAFAQTAGETREKRKIEKIIEKGSGDFRINDNIGVNTAPVTNSVMHVKGTDAAGSYPRMFVIEEENTSTNGTPGISLKSNRAGSYNWDFVSNFTNFGDLEFRVGASALADPTVKVMTLNKDGNVGIGTTSPVAKLEVYKIGTFEGLGMNNPNGERFSLKMIGDGVNQRLGFMRNDTTEMMTIGMGTSAGGIGNVGIGTSSPNHPLDVKGTIAISGSTSGTAKVNNVSSDSTEVFHYIGSSQSLFRKQDDSANVAVVNNTGLFVNSSAIASSKFGVRGDTDTSSQYTARFENNSGNGIFSILNNGEADFRDASNNLSMRIGSSGKIGIGQQPKTSPQVTINYGSNEGMAFNTSNTTGIFRQIDFRYANDASRAGDIVSNLTSGTTAYNVSSDKRLKNDLGEWTALDLIESVPARKYERKTQPGVIEYGHFAQELNTVLPQAVTEGGENVSSDPWMIDYSKTSGVLWKAVQELNKAIQEKQAIIEKQKAQNDLMKTWICSQADAPVELCAGF